MKSCQHCNVALYKTDGCDHMTCNCGFEFCWDCGSCYLRGEEDESMLLTRHERSCAHFDGDCGYEIFGILLPDIAAGHQKVHFSTKHSAFRVSVDFKEHPIRGVEVVTRDFLSFGQ